ncbi:uncharacterized protein LOC125750178 [Brienomyrus brachyistius]|uniref:uncharacterized protein LOC125750178 n=1 Tax=Brienomyrus brachyistius TaxID=42636 RepID=UPI0020B45AF3|nr:uncharacterized protein LOC125750178 [Brienomyrus brachyistius]
MIEQSNPLNLQQSPNLGNYKSDLTQREDVGAGGLEASCGRHMSDVMEMPHRCQDTCSSADAATTAPFGSQSVSTLAEDTSSHQTRGCEEAAVAVHGKNWIQRPPTPDLLHLGARDWEVTDEINGLYRTFFKEECAAVIHCIRQCPSWASAPGTCASLDFSKIETEPSPLCDWTMESSHLQVEDGSSKLGLTVQKVQGMGCTIPSVVEEGKEEEWYQESSGSSVSICKRTWVSCGSKDTACIKSSTNSSPECKLNHLNTQGSKRETGDQAVFVDCLEEVGSETEQKGSSSLIDGATARALRPNTVESASNLTTDIFDLNSSKGTHTVSESSISTNSVSDSGQMEVECKNNLTECIPGPRSAVELTLNQFLGNASELKVTLQGENLANPELTAGLIRPCASLAGNETIPVILESKGKVNEPKGDIAVEPVTGMNLTATTIEPVFALECGAEPVLEKVESKDNLSQQSLGATCQSEHTVDEKVVPVSDTTYDISVEAGNTGGISMCSLDGTLDKGVFVTSTPLIMPKSFNFAKVAPPTASHIKKKSDIGSVVKEPSVNMSSAAGPSTDICVNLPPPSRLKCPTKVLPKPTTWTRRPGREASSSNIVSNKKSLLSTLGPPTNRKSLQPPLKSSAIPLCLSVRGPSSSGVSSLCRKIDLNSRHMASTSSLEGKKLISPAGTKVVSSTLPKHLPSTLGPRRSQLGLVSSTALEKTSQPPTLSQKQPRGNTDDALPISKRKKIDTPGSDTSSMAAKGMAASTSVFKRPATRQTSMQLKNRKTGASRKSGTLISKTSADASALAKPCETGPQLSKVETAARNAGMMEPLRPIFALQRLKSLRH